MKWRARRVKTARGRGGIHGAGAGLEEAGPGRSDPRGGAFGVLRGSAGPRR